MNLSKIKYEYELRINLFFFKKGFTCQRQLHHLLLLWFNRKSKFISNVMFVKPFLEKWIYIRIAILFTLSPHWTILFTKFDFFIYYILYIYILYIIISLKALRHAVFKLRFQTKDIISIYVNYYVSHFIRLVKNISIIPQFSFSW